MTQNFGPADREGIKVLVHLVRPVSAEGLKKIKNPRAKNMAYIPLKPVLMIPPYVHTKQELAEHIYNNFGASEEGITYCLRYWMKKGKWSRRLKRLCMIKLWDKPDGTFKYKFLDMGVLRRFGWWED